MTERIQKIIKSKGLSPSQFADQIHVQRSSVSHILSGRNKPSLDFVMKVLSSYPDVDAEWLLFGKGKMTIKDNSDLTKEHDKIIPLLEKSSTPHPELKDIISNEEKTANDEPTAYYGKRNGIDKIVIFYSDKTFIVYQQQ